MAGVNKVILVGNLGKDPEIRVLESGTKVATFSLATTESYKDRNSGERVDKTEWHNVVIWRALADVAERFLKKGNQVYIEGKLQTRSYEDKEGNTRYTTEVVAQNMTMLGGRPSDGGGSPSQSSSSSSSSEPAEMKSDLAANDDTDDLPF